MLDSLGVCSYPNSYSTNYTGVKVADNQFLSVPQNTTTEDFKEYLKLYYPQQYQALENISNKYPPKELTPEEIEKLENTQLKGIKSPKPSMLKSIWIKIKNWFSRGTEKAQKVELTDIADYVDKGLQVKDCYDRIQDYYERNKTLNN